MWLQGFERFLTICQLVGSVAWYSMGKRRLRLNESRQQKKYGCWIRLPFLTIFIWKQKRLHAISKATQNVKRVICHYAWQDSLETKAPAASLKLDENKVQRISWDATALHWSLPECINIQKNCVGFSRAYWWSMEIQQISFCKACVELTTHHATCPRWCGHRWSQGITLA